MSARAPVYHRRVRGATAPPRICAARRGLLESAAAMSATPVTETRFLRLDLPDGGLRLEKGGVLRQVDVAYETCGELSPERDNVVFVCHALTGDAHVAGRHRWEAPRPAGGATW